MLSLADLLGYLPPSGISPVYGAQWTNPTGLPLWPARSYVSTPLSSRSDTTRQPSDPDAWQQSAGPSAFNSLPSNQSPEAGAPPMNISADLPPGGLLGGHPTVRGGIANAGSGILGYIKNLNTDAPTNLNPIDQPDADQLGTLFRPTSMPFLSLSNNDIGTGVASPQTDFVPLTSPAQMGDEQNKSIYVDKSKYDPSSQATNFAVPDLIPGFTQYFSLQSGQRTSQFSDENSQNAFSGTVEPTLGVQLTPNEQEPPHDGADFTGRSHVYAQIYNPESEESLSPSRDTNSQISGGTQQDDFSRYLQRAQYIEPSAVTGDQRIDRTTEFLLDALVQSVENMGRNVPSGMRATVFGTLVHADFGKRVKVLDLPGISENDIEQSFSMKELARYGLAGSFRTDVLLRDGFGHPLAIYDLKTGNAQLTRERIQELRDAVGFPNIPVIELRYRELTALQR